MVEGTRWIEQIERIEAAADERDHRRKRGRLMGRDVEVKEDEEKIEIPPPAEVFPRKIQGKPLKEESLLEELEEIEVVGDVRLPQGPLALIQIGGPERVVLVDELQGSRPIQKIRVGNLVGPGLLEAFLERLIGLHVIVLAFGGQLGSEEALLHALNARGRLTCVSLRRPNPFGKIAPRVVAANPDLWKELLVLLLAS